MAKLDFFLTVDMLPMWKFVKNSLRLFKVLKAVGGDAKRGL